jgi:hypothetical protein
MKWSLANCKLLPSHAHNCDQAFIHKVLWRFHISAFLHFNIPVVKCFDTSNSRYLKLAPKGVFFILTFRHFGIPMVKCFDTSNSRYPKPARKGVFRISAFRHFGILVVKCFDTPTPSIRNLHQKVFFAF